MLSIDWINNSSSLCSACMVSPAEMTPRRSAATNPFATFKVPKSRNDSLAAVSQHLLDPQGVGWDGIIDEPGQRHRRVQNKAPHLRPSLIRSFTVIPLGRGL